MSLAIDIDHVKGVLLADGWHEVACSDNLSSFEVDAYEFGQRDRDNISFLAGGGNGAQWHDVKLETDIFVPLSSILAVRY